LFGDSTYGGLGRREEREGRREKGGERREEREGMRFKG
jgi:hypothetical protein